MLICNVVGARPNFMKIAPIVHELQRRRLPQILVHTGQHYDANMSQVFFDELGLPRPDVYLDIGSDTHARQTARIMMAFEEICNQHKPDLVIVSGDVNSTLAAALVASKLEIPVAHVEAGLRSFDRTMPEEINRVLTDHVSDFLFTTEASGDDHLREEGISPEKIYFVGNCMVDSLLAHVNAALRQASWERFSLQPGGYALLTLHRPSNVDERENLAPLIEVINEISQQLPVLFPVHPRTRSRMNDWGIAVAPTVLLEDPLPYLTFLGLMAKAKFVLTDSGGIQEETTVLSVPCLTLRWNTERPVTITSGTNRLVGTDKAKIRACVADILAGNWQMGERPPLWDGQASRRVVDVIEKWDIGR
jgi:UDP-N-acetylglucosamine 2-epimerase (non-hydrolysing)